MTPERKAELERELEALLGPSEPKPQPAKVVAVDGRVVRDADVKVSRADPNARHGETVAVRRAAPMPSEPPLPSMRAGEVRIDMAAYTARRLADEADRAMERQRRRQLDPCNLGLYGRFDE